MDVRKRESERDKYKNELEQDKIRNIKKRDNKMTDIERKQRGERKKERKRPR
jgi:hypothetical protein